MLEVFSIVDRLIACVFLSVLMVRFIHDDHWPTLLKTLKSIRLREASARRRRPQIYRQQTQLDPPEFEHEVQDRASCTLLDGRQVASTVMIESRGVGHMSFLLSLNVLEVLRTVSGLLDKS